MKTLGHMVLEKKIFFFSNCTKGAIIDPPEWGHFWPQGHAWQIYVKLHITMLHTKYRSFGCCGFREEDFLCIFHCKPMADNDAPRAGPVWTPGTWLAGFIKRTTIHCYIQNMKALGLVVSEKKIFYVFPMTPLGQGPYGPQGQGWQDL